MSTEPASDRSGLLGAFDRVQAAVRAIWRRQRQRRPWLDHLARSYRRYKDVNGDHLAAAITYFSFLALFPMLLLGISIAAFVLVRHQNLVGELTAAIQRNVPGAVGNEFTQVLKTSLERRGTIGVVGLLGVGYAGLGWIANLRTSIQMVWTCETVDENPIKAKLEDLLALVGLGLGILVSLTLTTGGTAVAGRLIELAGLDGTPGLGTAVAALTILLAVATDTLVFAWLFVRLPRRPVRLGSALRGALFAAVGYEGIKLLGTFYLARVGANGIYGTFVGVVGLLIWINLTSRFLLFAAAWTATSVESPVGDACPDPPEPDTAQPGTPETDTPEPGTAQPGRQLGPPETDTAQPGTAQSGTAQPDTSVAVADRPPDSSTLGARPGTSG